LQHTANLHGNPEKFFVAISNPEKFFVAISLTASKKFNYVAGFFMTEEKACFFMTEEKACFLSTGRRAEKSMLFYLCA
jgi:hypothetical protein